MQWNRTWQAGFSKGNPWIAVNPNYPQINAEDEMSDPDSVFCYYKKLIELRHQNPLIVYGKYELLEEQHQKLFIYTRTFNEQQLLVICNYTKEWQILPQHIAELVPSTAMILISNYSSQEKDGYSKEQIAPYEATVYQYTCNRNI